MTDEKLLFRTADDKDPFEALQKWTTWLFGLNTTLAALAFGTGRLVVSPKGAAAILPSLSAVCFGISLAFTAYAYGLAVAETQPVGRDRLYTRDAWDQLKGAFNRKRKALRVASVSLGTALLLAALTPLAAQICSPGRGLCLRPPKVVISYTLEDTTLVFQDTISSEAQVLHARASGRELSADRMLSLVLGDSGGVRRYAEKRAPPAEDGRVEVEVSALFQEPETVLLTAMWCASAEEADDCREDLVLRPTPRGR